MKTQNAIFNDNFALGFYGKPTSAEKSFGEELLEVLKQMYKEGRIKHTEKKRITGYITIGSAISNIKLETTCAHDVRNEFIKELFDNIDGVAIKAIWLNVDGTNYTTFTFKNEDIKCLFP